jgi:hypothetical protein
MEPETLEHFLLDCNVLAETREPYISELNVLIKECHPCVNLRLLLGSVFNMLFLLVFHAKHNLRVTCSKVYKVFKQLQSQPQPQHYRTEILPRQDKTRHGDNVLVQSG